jgi:predicted SnoaL-like aldol condensation-catalyzing enzyme
MKQNLIVLTLFACVALASPALAQVPVAAAANPEALFTDPDPKLHANKQVALRIVRDLLEANHWADAPKYLDENYIQHNPMIATGLAPVMKFFGSAKPTPIPDSRSWRTKVVSVVAEDDLVVVALLRELDDPRKPGAKYTTTWFDMWRIRDGKAVEHWDFGTIAPPAR